MRTCAAGLGVILGLSGYHRSWIWFTASFTKRFHTLAFILTLPFITDFEVKDGPCVIRKREGQPNYGALTHKSWNLSFKKYNEAHTCDCSGHPGRRRIRRLGGPKLDTQNDRAAPRFVA
jgi:hypothetical protein